MIGAFRAGVLSGGDFSPSALFAAGEQGIWYDPSDFNTLFQDAAGTTPVTAVDQPVGKILDKSGRGNHATQSTSNDFRPVLKQDENGLYYLLFDGANDALNISAVNFSTTSQITTWIGLRKLQSTFGFIWESNASITPVLAIVSSAGNWPNYDIEFATEQGFTNGYTASNYASPNTSVITGVFDAANPQSLASRLLIRVNGANQSLTFDGQGNPIASALSNASLHIGARNGVQYYRDLICYASDRE